MPPGYSQKPHDQDGDDDDDDEPLPRYPEHEDDHNLVPNYSPRNTKATAIPVPGATNYPVTHTQQRKSKVPPFRVPIDRLSLRTGNRNPEHQRKKRVIDQPWELTDPNVERQSTNSRSRGREKGVMETHDRGSHETNHATPSRANRGSTARLKSEQLKEGLAGGSSINNMKDIQKEERFSIPHDHHQAWIQKMARNGMSLNAADSEGEDGLDIGNTIVLTCFRRGRVVLGNKTGVSVRLDPFGKFNVSEGDREWKEYGFPLDQVKSVWMNNTKDYVYITLNRAHNEIPNGRQIWWRLKQPCLDIDSRFFKNIHCQIRPTPIIEERENLLKSLPEQQPLGNVICKAIGQEDLDRKPPDIVSSDPFPKGTRDSRNTRSRNAQRAKPVTSLLPGMQYNNGDDDAYLGSPARPLSLMPQVDRDKPPLVWPPSGKKRVTVDYQDLERLEDEQFLNDNIINFYLRFLEEKLAQEHPALAQKTHFFNTFFYERLSQKTVDKKANLQALMKWTARVDLFTKQYVIIPINENAHWYLVIICNLPHLEAKLKANAGDSQGEEAEATIVSAPDSPPEEEGTSSEVELPVVAEATVESPDRMDLDDPSQQRPATAEGQLLSELSNLGPASSPEPMDIDEPGSGHEGEWPSEGELEGASNHHISEFNYSPINEHAQEGDGEITVNTDDPDKKRVKRQKKLPARAKKPPRSVDLNSPTIIILDSLSIGFRRKTFSLLRDYLEVEASEKKGWIIPHGFVTGVYAKVPKQSNWCDCGVYLLCYVEGFLHRAEEFVQEFLQKVNCQKGRFDEMTFTGMRQKLKTLIIRLHKEQHEDQEKGDVANSCAVKAQAQSNISSEEIQEVGSEGGGPPPVERRVAVNEYGLRPEHERIMKLVNSIQSLPERQNEQLTGSRPTSLTQSNDIIRRRRFTPEPELERRAGPGPTSSSHFSHVEIPGRVCARSPESLQSPPSSPSSSESTPITKGSKAPRPTQSAEEPTSPRK